MENIVNGNHSSPIRDQFPPGQIRETLIDQR